MTGSRDEMTQEVRGKAKVKGNLVPSTRQGVPPRVPRVRADPRDPPLADHDLERQLPLLLEEPRRSDPPPQPAMRAVTNQRNNAGPTTQENASSEIPVPETIHDREDRSLRRRRASNSKNGKVGPDALTRLHHAPQEENFPECADNGRNSASAKLEYKTANFSTLK